MTMNHAPMAVSVDDANLIIRTTTNTTATPSSMVIIEIGETHNSESILPSGADVDTGSFIDDSYSDGIVEDGTNLTSNTNLPADSHAAAGILVALQDDHNLADVAPSQSSPASQALVLTRGRRNKQLVTTEVKRSSRINKYNGFKASQISDTKATTSKVLP